MTRSALAGAWLTVALLWSQFFLTARHAGIDGGLHGSKRPLYLAVLVVATAALLLPRRAPVDAAPDRTLSRIVLAGAAAFMAIAGVVWFPPSVWGAIPYADNWTSRFLSTADGLQLLRDGAATGWIWDFLGGYHSASDITQSLTLLAAAPMMVFGDAAGFHLLHILLLTGIPVLVYIDLRVAGDRDVAALGAGLSAAGVAAIAYVLLRSGDTNSLAGVATTALAMMAAHAAAAGRRWGAPLLMLAMPMAAWSHTGFFAYAGFFLLLEAAIERDRRRAIRATVSVAIGLIAALPLTWELWRYPQYFIANNVIVEPGQAVNWIGVARKIFYNVELFWLPGRWFNDISGLTYVLLPLLAVTAWSTRGRVRFYAAASLAVMAITRLQSPESAYFFVRPMHLLAVFTPVAIAGFVSHVVGDRWRRWAIIALTAVYLPMWWHAVPHLQPDEIEPALVQHMRGLNLNGAMVLLENTPHRDMDADPNRDIEPAPIPAHFESIVPRLTGARLYAGLWDGWQWCPQRLNVLAGGAFRGRSLSVTPHANVHSELTRWGIRHLVVWSKTAIAFFEADPSFARRWSSGPWVHYEFLAADPRDVVTSSGTGELADRTPLAARVLLQNVRAGTRVVIRTNFYPVWTAWDRDSPVPLIDDGGMLAFDAPRDGSYEIDLRYPRRTWLLAMAFVVVAAGTFVSTIPQSSETSSFRRRRSGRS